MIFIMAATSAYDENEVYVHIQAESGECIKVGDILHIPMNDRTFEDREIKAMFHDYIKWNKGKESMSEIKEGEWAECMINGIHSGKIHTISSPYDDEILEGTYICC